MPLALRGCVAVALDDHRFLVLGGRIQGHLRTDGSNWYDGVQKKKVFLYDFRTRTWTKLLSMKHNRVDPVAIKEGSRIYVAGGQQSEGKKSVEVLELPNNFSADTPTSQLATLPWRKVKAQLPTDLTFAGGMVGPDKLFLWGGGLALWKDHPKKVFVLDTRTEAVFPHTVELPTPAYGPEAVVSMGHERSQLFLWSPINRPTLVYDTTHQGDSSSFSWSQGVWKRLPPTSYQPAQEDLTTSRRATGLLYKNILPLVVGGKAPLLYDGREWRELPPLTGQLPRNNYAATIVGDRLVVVGGADASPGSFSPEREVCRSSAICLDLSRITIDS